MMTKKDFNRIAEIIKNADSVGGSENIKEVYLWKDGLVKDLSEYFGQANHGGG